MNVKDEWVLEAFVDGQLYEFRSVQFDIFVVRIAVSSEELAWKAVGAINFDFTKVSK